MQGDHAVVHGGSTVSLSDRENDAQEGVKRL
jgi:hypothetical protein